MNRFSLAVIAVLTFGCGASDEGSSAKSKLPEVARASEPGKTTSSREESARPVETIKSAVATPLRSEDSPGEPTPDGEASVSAGTKPGSAEARGEATVGSGAPGESLVQNGGFESGDRAWLAHWSVGASAPPRRSDLEARSGKFSVQAKLENQGATPSEGLLIQVVDREIVGGSIYELSFWAKQISSGASYVQQYQLQWAGLGGDPELGTVGVLPGGRDFTPFRGGDGGWVRTTVSGLEAPAGARTLRVLFRFVTGAVAAGAGEVFVDDVALVRTSGDGAEGVESARTEGSGEAVGSVSDRSTLAGDVPDANDASWRRLVVLLESGLSKLDAARLDEALELVNDLRTRWRDSDSFRNVMELVLLYYDSPRLEDPFEEKAEAWVLRNEASPLGAQVLLDLARLQVERSDAKAAARWMAEYTKRFPHGVTSKDVQDLREKMERLDQ